MTNLLSKERLEHGTSKYNGSYYMCQCPQCGWFGSSEDIIGGQEQCDCPNCYTEVDEIDEGQLWDIVLPRLVELDQRREAAEKPVAEIRCMEDMSLRVENVADGFNLGRYKVFAAPPLPVVPQALLRELVDVVWQEAKEGTEVPSTKWADELIGKVFPAVTTQDAIAWRWFDGRGYNSTTDKKQADELVKDGVVVEALGLLQALPVVPDEMREALYKIANHIAGAKGGLPTEWQDWAEEIETDIRRAAMLQLFGNSEQVTPTISFYRDGIVAAAQWVEKRRKAYDSEHGRHDPDTGTFEFGNDVQQEYSETLRDIEEGIRALHPNAASNSPVIPEGYKLALAPMEHTEEFRSACSAAFEEFNRGTGPCGVFIAGHRAMLAADPQPGESS